MILKQIMTVIFSVLALREGASEQTRGTEVHATQEYNHRRWKGTRMAQINLQRTLAGKVHAHAAGKRCISQVNISQAKSLLHDYIDTQTVYLCNVSTE